MNFIIKIKLIKIDNNYETEDKAASEKINEDINELNKILFDIFEEDGMVDIIIDINTQNKEICIGENYNKKE